MKRVSVAVAIGALLLPALSSAGSTQPSLRYLTVEGKTTTPRVLGAHFKPGERVGVTLRSGKTKLVRTAHASSAGKFTVHFTILPQSKCTGTISLTAIGANGDRAVFTLPSSTSCAPTSAASVSVGETPTATTTTPAPYGGTKTTGTPAS